ncbi:MAG: response regulator [Acidimicrobiales bacterium]
MVPSTFGGDAGAVPGVIRLLVADDSPAVRRGVIHLLANRDEFLVVGEAENGRVALRLAQLLEPDVVLMDISMPVLDGLAAARALAGTRALVGTGKTPAVVLFSAWVDPQRLAEASAAGVAGHVLKDAPAEELLAALRTAAADP